jgi:hypothetical protein
MVVTFKSRMTALVKRVTVREDETERRARGAAVPAGVQ